MRIKVGKYVVLFGVLSNGCSLMGLDAPATRSCVDPSDPESDNRPRDARCSALNTLSPTGDPCLVWQCGASGFCEVDTLDADGDGAPASTCEDDPLLADCDDDNKDNAPGLAETCDLGDNDCDGFIDNGILRLAQGESVGQTTALASVDYAVLPDGLMPIVNSSAGAQAGTTLAALATPSERAYSSASFVSGQSTPVFLAVGQVNTNSVPTVALSICAATQSGGLVNCAAAAMGNSELVGDVCDRPDQMSGRCVGPIEVVRSAATAGNRLLVRWLENADAVDQLRSCDDHPASAVRYGVITFDSLGVPSAATPVLVGQNPSVDTVPGGAVAESDNSWIVAYSTSTGQIFVDRLTLEQGALSTTNLTTLTTQGAYGVALHKRGNEFLLTYRQSSDCSLATAVVLTAFAVNGPTLITNWTHSITGTGLRNYAIYDAGSEWHVVTTTSGNAARTSLNRIRVRNNVVSVDTTDGSFSAVGSPRSIGLVPAAAESVTVRASGFFVNGATQALTPLTVQCEAQLPNP